MKRLLFTALLLLVALPLEAKDSFQAAVTPAAAVHPSLYSFADVYRLTVTGQAPALPPQAESPVRVAAAAPSLLPEAQFSVSGSRAPQRWALLIAGLLLAGWVAHRRMDTLL